jgi:transposase
MYVATVPNRSSPPAILLRESFREGGKVRNRTLANLSDWSSERVEALRLVLQGRQSPREAKAESSALEIVRSRPHGHVAAVVGTLRRLGLDRVISSRATTQRSLVLAMVVQRIIAPASKLATARSLAEATGASTLKEVLALAESVDEDDLYAALDWLLERQEAIERSLAKRHLVAGELVLYDVSSTYVEGRSCPLAKLGHSRDGQRDKLQIVFGVLTNGQGCPVAVEVFEGNTADPKTVKAALGKVQGRFGLQRLILVGDRGMLTAARIEQELAGVEGLEWITALRSPAIAALVKDEAIQPSLFDQQDLAEITHPDYPGERLIVCKNPLLAAERERKRGELLAATERELEKIAAATRRAKRPLRGGAQIGLRVGKVQGRYKVGKHFKLEVGDTSFRYQRNEIGIAEEAALDGFYVIRTSVGNERMTAEQTVQSYKQLAEVERGFRSMKTVDLHVRPIHHRKADRVRAHVFLCLLSYYVQWHMRRALQPILFDDDDKAAAQAARRSIVAPAQRSPRAKTKAATKRTPDGLPVHSFQTLLNDLATLTKNRVRFGPDRQTIEILATATEVQARVFQLLGVSPRM